MKMQKQHGPPGMINWIQKMTQIADEQQQLAQGITTPDEFIETCDSLVKK